MEVKGRIKKVLQVRSGVSQRTGNEWKALPFVVEFFENPTDRFPDSVVVETMDTNLMPSIREGVDVKIGISHHAREYEGRMYNEVRMYRFELTGSQQPADNAQAAGANNSPQPQQNAPTGTENAGGDSDDLPF